VELIESQKKKKKNQLSDRLSKLLKCFLEIFYFYSMREILTNYIISNNVKIKSQVIPRKARSRMNSTCSWVEVSLKNRVLNVALTQSVILNVFKY
jgi:hypothetical protein